VTLNEVKERFPMATPETKLPTSPIETLHTVELTREWVPELQRFFEANPLYFMEVNGEPAGPNEAHEEIFGELPPGWSFTKKWVIGYMDASNSMVAMANMITDLLAPNVWHIGTFIMATTRLRRDEGPAWTRNLDQDHGTAESHPRAEH